MSDPKLLELMLSVSDKGVHFSRRPFLIKSQTAKTITCVEVTFGLDSMPKKFKTMDLNLLSKNLHFFPRHRFTILCLETDEVKYSREMVGVEYKPYKTMKGMKRVDIRDLMKEAEERITARAANIDPVTGTKKTKN